MPGIAEFLAEGPDKLIIAELPDGHVMLTMVNTINGGAALDHHAPHRGACRRQHPPLRGAERPLTGDQP
jgi:hypothetical protein